MKFGVVVFPSKSLQDLANSYRKRYDPHYALIPPHLTLKNSFEATEDDAVQFAVKLRHIAENSKPFTLKTSKISSFVPVNNVIYFKVEPTEELINLHSEINQEFREQNLEYAFVPHITIGQKLSNDEHSDVYGQLRMTSVEHEETVDRFHLLYQLDNGSWTVYETFRLGKDKWNVTFKIAQTVQEREDAYSIRRTVFIDEQNVPEEEEIDQYEDESTHFVLYDNGIPVGAGRFRMMDEYGKVERICVLKDARNTGAGRKIMNGIEAFAQKQGVQILKLNAQTHAIPFYDRLGYEVASGEFLDAGIPHKTMIKNI